MKSKRSTMFRISPVALLLLVIPGCGRSEQSDAVSNGEKSENQQASSNVGQQKPARNIVNKNGGQAPTDSAAGKTTAEIDGAPAITGNTSSVSANQPARQQKPIILKAPKKFSGWRFVAVAISPKQDVVVAGRSNGTAMLWDVATRKVAGTLPGDGKSSVTNVAFSSDGKSVAGRAYNDVVLWDVAGRKTIATLKGHIAAVTGIAFGPDGKLLATCSQDSSVRLWDLKTHDCTETFRGHKGRLTSVAFSPDGKTVASGGDDKTIRLWKVGSGESQATLTGHSRRLNAIAFSADGKSLASSSDDMSIKLWDVGSAKEIKTLKPGRGVPSWIYYGADGESLVVAVQTSQANSEVQVWDVGSGKMASKSPKYNLFGMCLSRDGRTVALASRDDIELRPVPMPRSK